jgi:hypothetical protein
MEDSGWLHYDIANATSARVMAALLKLVPTSQITNGTDYLYFPLNQSEHLQEFGLSEADMHAD